MKHLPGETIARLLDGELGRIEAAEAIAHLRGCSRCRAVAEELRLGNAAFSAGRQTGDRPTPPGPECPSEAILLAYADGSLRSTEERGRLAAHLSTCERCSRRAGEASSSLRLLDEAARAGAGPLPAHLEEMVRDRFFPRDRFLGRVVARLKEILDGGGSWLGYTALPETGWGGNVQATFISPLVRESSGPDYLQTGAGAPCAMAPAEARGGEPRTAPRPAGRKKRRDAPERPKPPGLRELRFRAGTGGGVEASLTIVDGEGRPLAGATVEIEQKGRTVSASATDRNGRARFGGIARGRYRLRIRHGPGAYLELDLA